MTVRIVEKSVKAGDFDARSRAPKRETGTYMKHGLPFVIMTTLLILGAQFILDTLSSLMNLIVISVYDAPDIITSPFTSSVILTILLAFGIITIAYLYGLLNRVLTEKLWHEKQNRLWDRHLGQGLILLVVLSAVHLPLYPFYVLWVSGLILEQIVFLIVYVFILSIIDGIFAKYLATVDFG